MGGASAFESAASRPKASHAFGQSGAHAAPADVALANPILSNPAVLVALAAVLVLLIAAVFGISACSAQEDSLASAESSSTASSSESDDGWRPENDDFNYAEMYANVAPPSSGTDSSSYADSAYGYIIEEVVEAPANMDEVNAYLSGSYKPSTSYSARPPQNMDEVNAILNSGRY